MKPCTRGLYPKGALTGTVPMDTYTSPYREYMSEGTEKTDFIRNRLRLI